MSEVTTWNPTDNANTAAPPDGWPEGMQPSAVNDTARMMMGALRREHDRITAQIGSVAGTISTTTINATTISTTGAITASGAITGSAINSTGNASVAGYGYFGGDVQIHGGGSEALLVDNGGIRVAGDSRFDSSVTAAAFIGGTITGTTLTMNGSVSIVAGGNFHVDGTGYFGGDLQVNGGGSDALLVSSGAIHVAGDSRFDLSVTAASYITSSDARLKADIEELQPGSLSLVQSIVPRSYRLTNVPSQTQHYGFVAQEVWQAMQAAGREFGGHVVDEESGRQGLAYNELLALLWGAVQELSAQVETLKQERDHV